MSEHKPNLDGPGFRIHHTMLPVADLDRSIDFYQRLLGMRIQERHASAARQTEVALVGYGAEATGPFLELTKNTSSTAPAVAPLGNHVGIHVNALRQLCAHLEQEGVSFVRPFKERGDSKGFTAWVHDPDGHAIELVELHSA